MKECVSCRCCAPGVVPEGGFKGTLNWEIPEVRVTTCFNPFWWVNQCLTTITQGWGVLWPWSWYLHRTLRGGATEETYCRPESLFSNRGAKSLCFWKSFYASTILLCFSWRSMGGRWGEMIWLTRWDHCWWTVLIWWWWWWWWVTTLGDGTEVPPTLLPPPQWGDLTHIGSLEILVTVARSPSVSTVS